MNRTAPSAAASCPVVLTDTDEPCGTPVRSNRLCSHHLWRHRNGWTDEQLGRPKGAQRVDRSRCEVVLHDSGQFCGDSTTGSQYCKFHRQRVAQGFQPDRLGEPRHRAKPVAIEIDLEALRLGRREFATDDELAQEYLSDVRQYRRWLEIEVLTYPDLLDRPESQVVALYLTAMHSEGLKASTIDHRAAGISWWARRVNRVDPLDDRGLADLRRGLRRADRDDTGPIAAELTMPEVARVIAHMSGDLWSAVALDPHPLELLGRAAFITQLHLLGRYSDLARLDMIDAHRFEDEWRITPWVRKNWPGGTPDGLWLLGTKDPIFDPVVAMDEWMAFRSTLGPRGHLFCGYSRGQWDPYVPFSYEQYLAFLKRCAHAAQLEVVPGTHSLRRTSVQTLTDQGATEPELLALTGLRDTRTLRKYQRRSRSSAGSAGQTILSARGAKAPSQHKDPR